MTELFLSVLNRSFAASFLVLAVLAARPLLKKAPRWVRVVLWGLVAVRLVMPSLPESGLSLVPSSQVVGPQIMLDETPTVHTGIDALNGVVNPMLQQSFTPQAGASVNPLQIWLPLGAAVWAVGVAAMAVYTLVSWLRLRRQVRTAVRLRENIFQSEHVASPFVLGVIRPRIYLPFGMEAGALDHVIAHEQAHIRRKDHWWKPLGFCLLAIHWFNPLLWLAYILLCRDIELACDEKVIRSLDMQDRADYSQALLSCSVSRRSIAACPLAFGEVGVKERIKRVLSYKKPAFWIVLAAVLVCVGVGVFFLTDPVEEPASLAGNRYAGGKLLADSPALSYVPEDGGFYQDICISDEGLRLYVEFDGVREYPFCVTRTYTRRELLRELSGELLGVRQGESLEELLPPCREVEIRMYYESDEDSNPGFSVYFFDGEPLWLAERKALRIYALELTATGQSCDKLTLVDVLALAQLDTIDWDDLAPYHGEDIGSGLYIVSYPIDTVYHLEAVGASTEEPPWQVRLVFSGMDDYILLGDGDLEQFLEEHQIAYMQAMVSRAVLDQYAPEEDGRIHVESHVILGQQKQTEVHTVYMLVLHQAYHAENGTLESVSGTYVPTALTFSVDEAGQYRLVDYWEPRDGSDYDDDIKARFPENAEKAALNHQNYIDDLEAENYQKAMAAMEKNGSITQQIDELLEVITSSPLEQSNPGAYIEAHREAYNRLISYGEYTLRYCFQRFLMGNETGLDGHIMAIACEQIMLGWGEAMIIEEGWMTGQGWFNHFYSNAKTLLEQMSLAELEKLYPGSYILLQMTRTGTRVYVYQNGDLMPPCVVLYDNGSFSFTFSAVSSYIGIGHYTSDNDRVCLYTDDGKFVYFFHVVNDTLVFDGDASSDIVWFADLPDGAVFE